jgi:hypothetical protein
VVGCTYPGAVSAKAGQGGARERAEDLVAILIRPAQPILQETQPTNTIRSVDTKQGRKGELGMEEAARTGSRRSGRRRRRRGPARPPTHQQRSRWPAAGEAGRRLLPRARSLALIVQLPSPPDLINLISFITTLWHPPNSRLIALCLCCWEYLLGPGEKNQAPVVR